MPVDRPTFSESRYRVADLRPRLRSTVQVYRQHFRGQLWHVLRDPANNQFFRLSDAGYAFVALLDGRRTVAQTWQACNSRLGDDAPTQGEAIQLLGQLYASNLLQAELPPDAEGLFRRYQKRVTREVQGYLMNLLFARIPILDPDHFLDRWVGLVDRLFSWYGLAAWLVLIVAGLYFVVGRAGEFKDLSSGVLDPSNLPLLYLSFVFIKVFHEFGHAFACKRFGRQEGSGGEVHVMGVMLLVFTPMPYVDASSAWALRSKWRRAVIGAAGMIVELAVAAVAAIVWANTGQGGIVHAIAYNVMFIASVSTLLFNGNPLLRYDGYYILSDLVEIPNLAQRGREYLYYLVKKYVYGVRQAQSPAHARGERAWLAVYAVASTIYRVVISVAILLFVAGKLFILGSILAIAAVIAWVVVPLGKFVRYLLTSGELARVRQRAVGATLVALAALLVGVGLIRVPDRCRAEGQVWPASYAEVYAGADGFLQGYLPSGREVSPAGPPLVTAVNPELSAQREELLARKCQLEAQHRLAGLDEVAAAQILAEQIRAIDEQIRRVEEQLAALKLQPPIAGTWISPDIDKFSGAYLRRGERVGLVASLDKSIIRAVAGQDIASLVVASARARVEMRLEGRPESEFMGTVVRILPAGQQYLPSPALGYAAGGSTETAQDDSRGLKAAERVFEIHIAPDADCQVRLLTGQRVAVRFQMPSKSLAAQGWRRLLQLIQRRFHI